MASKTLFFILGYPRSGTTLFRLMLNNHPELALPPECGFAEWMYEEFSSKRMNDNTYRVFLVKAFQSRKFETWGLNYDDVEESIMMNKPKNYQELVFEIYKCYASKVGKAINTMVWSSTKRHFVPWWELPRDPSHAHGLPNPITLTESPPLPHRISCQGGGSSGVREAKMILTCEHTGPRVVAKHT